MNIDDTQNILVVDDRPENLLSFEALLDGSNCGVIKANSGREALEKSLIYEFALILLDVQMPEMDGFETARRLRSAKKTKDIPIIFVTAINKDQKHIFQGYEAGAVDYLFKPIEPEILRSKVKVFLDLANQKRELKKYGLELNRLLAEHERAEKELRKVRHLEHYLAYYDTLTNLPNRSLFYDRLQQAMSQAMRNNGKIAVLFLDLDGFKEINDTLGHCKGDLLLKLVGQKLKGSLRECDTVARIGGDEFTIVLGDVRGPDDAARVARKILGKMSEPIALEGKNIVISTSIGLSMYPTDSNSIESIVKCADRAMYYAKIKGKNNCQAYHISMDIASQRRQAMESNLKRAVDNNEFIIHYQPQINILTKEITGVEALLRWRHPDLGMLCPDEFIPLAEDSGIIVQIGEWLLRSICEQKSKWHKAGIKPIRVSINLSPRQFSENNLVDTIKNILNEARIDPDGLELEITESCAMRDVEYTADTLHALKAWGLRISLDDFGTGYSSLSYLKRFPIDLLKIDRSFVNNIPEDRDNTAITTAIVALGHSLGMKTIAEGVETEEQLNFLQSIKCDEMQGYYFCKPTTQNRIERMLQAGNEAVMDNATVRA